MTPLVWADFPLMFLIAAAIIGVPAWMIFKRVDRPSDHSEAHSYLRAKAELQRTAAAGGTAHAQVSTMAAVAAPTAPPRGRWQLAPPRGRRPAGRPASAGRAARSHDRTAAARRSPSDA